MRARHLFLVLLVGLVVSTSVNAREIVGEVFARTVTEEEFLYHLKGAALFSRAGGGQQRTEEETRREAWLNLIYREEAVNVGVEVSRRKLEEELQRLVGERDVRYGTQEYARWVRQQFGEDVEVFERRIEDLLVVNEFMRMKSEPEVTITEKDIKDKFVDAHSSFESEYIRFDSKKKAEKFAGKARKKPRLWYETYNANKGEGQKGAAWINTMSIGALIDLWKIPREDAYRIHSGDMGDLVVGQFFYGDAVFRVLHKKDADMEKYTEQKRKEYMTQLQNRKKKELVDKYFADLEKRADYRDYVIEERRAASIEDLKKESEVTLETNQGNIVLTLFPDVAPKACQNFIGLAKKGYYDGIIFHRVIKGFMIQCGDPTGTGRGGESLWGESFEDEVNEGVVFDKPGILAMANAGPGTNGSQFFITTKPTPHLHMKHTIFGEVKEGYDVVEKIENTPTAGADKPKDDQKIIKAYVSGQ